MKRERERERERERLREKEATEKQNARSSSKKTKRMKNWVFLSSVASFLSPPQLSTPILTPRT
jgi:hypothetical protein